MEGDNERPRPTHSASIPMALEGAMVEEGEAARPQQQRQQSRPQHHHPHPPNGPPIPIHRVIIFFILVLITVLNLFLSMPLWVPADDEGLAFQEAVALRLNRSDRPTSPQTGAGSHALPRTRAAFFKLRTLLGADMQSSFPSLPPSLPVEPRPLPVSPHAARAVPLVALFAQGMNGSVAAMCPMPAALLRRSEAASSAVDFVPFNGLGRENSGGSGPQAPLRARRWLFSASHTTAWVSVLDAALRPLSMAAGIQEGGMGNSSLTGTPPGDASLPQHTRSIEHAADAALAKLFQERLASVPGGGRGDGSAGGGPSPPAVWLRAVKTLADAFIAYNADPSAVAAVPAYAVVCGPHDCHHLPRHLATFSSIGRLLLVINTAQAHWVAMADLLAAAFPGRVVAEYPMRWAMELMRLRHTGSLSISERTAESSSHSFASLVGPLLPVDGNGQPPSVYIPTAAHAHSGPDWTFAEGTDVQDAYTRAWTDAMRKTPAKSTRGARRHPKSGRVGKEGSSEQDPGAERRAARRYRRCLHALARDQHQEDSALSHPSNSSSYMYNNHTAAPPEVGDVDGVASMLAPVPITNVMGVSMNWNRILNLCFRGDHPTDYVIIANADYTLQDSRELSDFSAYVAQAIRGGPHATDAAASSSSSESTSAPSIIGYEDSLKFAFFAYTYAGAWHSVGEFDEFMFPGYFEDNEMHLRIRSGGGDTFPSFDVSRQGLLRREHAVGGSGLRSVPLTRSREASMRLLQHKYGVSEDMQRPRFTTPFNVPHLPLRSNWAVDATFRECALAQAQQASRGDGGSDTNIKCVLDLSKMQTLLSLGHGQIGSG